VEKIHEKMNVSKTDRHLLDTISTPADIRKLSVDDLPDLCEEIRACILENLSSNPGHFASSMGSVEIIVALHYVFNTPYDRLVWDVGHQAYAHKILTGRREAFKTQRKLGGISGFPNPKESEYDTFMAGHASNSISAALGYAIADMNTPGSEKRKTVAVIGDASISGGLAFEGLNNAANSKNNLLIVLNDNDMSINDNVGALHRYLSSLTTSRGYNNLRNRTYQRFKKLGLVTEKGRGLLLRFNNSIKALVAKRQNIFEGLNIRYFGPFDGHDVKKLVKIFTDIKEMEGPRILHLKTIKGKGFQAAEDDPTTWHAPGKFNPETGERAPKNNDTPLWQNVFGETLVRIAEQDDRIMGVTAAMPSGTSMIKMLKAFPDRSFDVGISEGHAVTFAGGMAAAGKHPFVAIYSSFLQRAYDNIIHDVAIQGLPVTFCIDRAGLVGEDGVTHHGVFDLAYLRVIPNMTIASPLSERQLRDLLYTASKYNGPMAIRYPRGKVTAPDWGKDMKQIEIGKGETIIEAPNAKIGVITIGPIGTDAEKAITELRGKGIDAALYNIIWLKPLDKDLLRTIMQRHRHILTIEDGCVSGGLGSSVADYITENNLSNSIIKLGIPDDWIHHGTVDQLRHICGFDMEGIKDAIIKLAAKD
jgi:1-deoxy-D-xylulose-5-phosphate synthase